MGNVDSTNAFDGVDELKDTLSDLESRLASIEAGHRKALRDAELDASNKKFVLRGGKPHELADKDIVVGDAPLCMEGGQG